jgi:hypothetical protein
MPRSYSINLVIGVARPGWQSPICGRKYDCIRHGSIPDEDQSRSEGAVWMIYPKLSLLEGAGKNRAPIRHPARAHRFGSARALHVSQQRSPAGTQQSLSNVRYYLLGCRAWAAPGFDRTGSVARRHRLITTVHSDQNVSPPHVEVITSVQRRRRWPTPRKIRLVEETMQSLTID